MVAIEGGGLWFGVEGAGEIFKEVLFLEAWEVVVDHTWGDFHDTAEEVGLLCGEGVGEELVEDGEAEAEEVLEERIDIFWGADEPHCFFDNIHFQWFGRK